MKKPAVVTFELVKQGMAYMGLCKFAYRPVLCDEFVARSRQSLPSYLKVTVSNQKFPRSRAVKIRKAAPIHHTVWVWQWLDKWRWRSMYDAARNELDMLFPNRKRATVYYRIEAA